MTLISTCPFANIYVSKITEGELTTILLEADIPGFIKEHIEDYPMEYEIEGICTDGSTIVCGGTTYYPTFTKLRQFDFQTTENLYLIRVRKYTTETWAEVNTESLDEAKMVIKYTTVVLPEIETILVGGDFAYDSVRLAFGCVGMSNTDEVYILRCDDAGIFSIVPQEAV